eukprot:scaffold731_cov261-Pinguiococcus_pyrenoidosus.AAC.82
MAPSKRIGSLETPRSGPSVLCSISRARQTGRNDRNLSRREAVLGHVQQEAEGRRAQRDRLELHSDLNCAIGRSDALHGRRDAEVGMLVKHFQVKLEVDRHVDLEEEAAHRLLRQRAMAHVQPAREVHLGHSWIGVHRHENVRRAAVKPQGIVVVSKLFRLQRHPNGPGKPWRNPLHALWLHLEGIALESHQVEAMSHRIHVGDPKPLRHLLMHVKLRKV